MKTFIVMTFVLFGTFFVGTLLGIQHMQEEIGLSQPEPLTYEKKEFDEEQERITIDELSNKKDRMEQVGNFNFFSDLGRFLAESANGASRALLSQLMSFVHNVLNGGGG